MAPFKTALLALAALALAACGAASAVEDWVDELGWLEEDSDPAPEPAATASFVHYATGTNTFDECTLVDHPIANANPEAFLIVTQNWNPGGVAGEVNAHNVAVRYDPLAAQWAIFNQNGDDVPFGAAFNVTVSSGPNAGATTFALHVASGDYTDDNFTWFDHVASNGNPFARILITLNATPAGAPERMNDHVVGVYYDGDTGRWTILNEDGSDIPEGTAYNIAIVETGAESPFLGAVLHEASGSGPLEYATAIDLSGDPLAILHATPVYTAEHGIEYDHPLGLLFRAADHRWYLFNEDLVDMENRAAFNVVLARP